MSEVKQGSIWSVYRRLSRYARPYKRRILIGVLMGLMGGSSLFGLFQLSPYLVRPFEQPVRQAGADEKAVAAPASGLPGDWSRFERAAAKAGVPVTDSQGRLTWQAIALGLLALPLLGIVKGVTNFINRYMMRWVGTRVCRDLRDHLFEHLQHQSLKFFGKCDIGRLISRCTNDAAVVEHVLANTLEDLTRAPFDIVFALAFAIHFTVDQEMAGFLGGMLVGFPLFIIPIIVLGQYVRRHTGKALGRIADLTSRMHENFTGVRVVKAAHTEAREISRFRELNASYFKSLVRALRGELMMAPLVETVGLCLTAAFFVVCYAQQVQLSQIVPIALAALVVYRPLKQLTRVHPNLSRGAAALERIYQILDVDDRLPEAPNAKRLDGFHDRIEFQQVGFSYETDGQAVLADIDVTLKRGQVLALVGESGSGKSTLANLLARFYDPTAGRILLDGVDLRDIEVASLRRLMAVVTQDTILFNDTISANIAYGLDGITRAQIEDAARQANAHEFIMADPSGYDRVVGEKGFVLSGGEKQRIALARAILRNPPILILDEATSALDTVTESMIQEAIARVMQHRTVFAIAHRLSTVRHADQILVVAEGRIVERGTHADLYEVGGRYRRLCDMQVLGK